MGLLDSKQGNNGGGDHGGVPSDQPPGPPDLPFKARVAEWNDGDQIGTVKAENGATLRFGASACSGFRPALGTNCWVVQTKPDPLGRGMRAKVLNLSGEAALTPADAALQRAAEEKREKEDARKRELKRVHDLHLQSAEDHYATVKSLTAFNVPVLFARIVMRLAMRSLIKMSVSCLLLVAFSACATTPTPPAATPIAQADATPPETFFGAARRQLCADISACVIAIPALPNHRSARIGELEASVVEVDELERLVAGHAVAAVAQYSVRPEGQTPGDHDPTALQVILRDDLGESRMNVLTLFAGVNTSPVVPDSAQSLFLIGEDMSCALSPVHRFLCEYPGYFANQGCGNSGDNPWRVLGQRPSPDVDPPYVFLSRCADEGVATLNLGVDENGVKILSLAAEPELSDPSQQCIQRALAAANISPTAEACWASIAIQFVGWREMAEGVITN